MLPDTIRENQSTIRVLFRLFGLLVAMAGWAAPTLAQPEQQLVPSLQAATPEQPLEVAVGVAVDQITDINQKAENLGVVASLRLEWSDPMLAFDAPEHGRDFKVYTLSAFTSYVDENAILAPGFIIKNQQGRRWSQEASVTVFADGRALYYERFSATLQAPDFDFVQYPFDKQRFWVHVESLWPTEYIRFVPLDGFSQLGDRLGEEEWVFSATLPETSEVANDIGMTVSQFSFGFTGSRHLNYYILRLFVPLFVIILVSWVTFFLKDFGKRVDIAGGNMLIFVAFNFTISGDLPRLGYLTFMDAIVVSGFAITGLVVVMNVVFKRLEVIGRENLARRIDGYAIWSYPAVWGGLVVLLCWYFFKPIL